MGQFAHHRLYREGTRYIRHRAEPADAGMGGGFWIFALDVGDLERHVDESHAEFDADLMRRTGGKSRPEAWRDAAVPPSDHLAVGIEAGFDAFGRDRVQEVVANVVLPRPLHLHR